VTVRCPGGILLHGLPKTLQRVLACLLENAMEHGYRDREPGPILIEARPRGTSQVEIRVADEGVGIGPEYLPKVFDPFITSRRSDGFSGLGLHIAHSLVTAALHGSLELESARGRGTTALLRLPLRLVALEP